MSDPPSDPPTDLRPDPASRPASVGASDPAASDPREGRAVAPPPLDGILETAIYVEDLDRAAAFYHQVFGLAPVLRDSRLVTLDVGGGRVLLLFRRGASLRQAELPGGSIPPHDGSGPMHFAFAAPHADISAWEGHLTRLGVPVEATLDWPNGSRSLYVRDPDGHLVEIASRHLWVRNDGP